MTSATARTGLGIGNLVTGAEVVILARTGAVGEEPDIDRSRLSHLLVCADGAGGVDL